MIRRALFVLAILTTVLPVAPASAGPDDPIPCVRPFWCRDPDPEP